MIDHRTLYHIVASFSIAVVVCLIFKSQRKEMTGKLLITVFVVSIIPGVYKEFFIDSFPGASDIVFNLLGSFVGVKVVA